MRAMTQQEAQAPMTDARHQPRRPARSPAPPPRPPRRAHAHRSAGDDRDDGIVLPAAMQGISMCLSASLDARQRSEAAALAEAKLTELIATGDWQYGGSFG